MLIPFREFAPDGSEFDIQACDRMENVLPKVNGFGPFPKFVSISSPLVARPQGAHLAYIGNGSYRVFAGTAAGLFVLNTTTLAWDDLSKIGGYLTPTSGRWNFIQFGDLLIATNNVDPPQSIDLSVALTSFADLGGTPPDARHLGVIGDFLMLLHLGADTRSIRWSGINAPTFWTARERLSDFQTFPDGGEIMGFSGFERGCVVFQEEAIREGSITGEAALVINFNKTVEDHGVAAPSSIVTTGQGIFYLSRNGFYRYGSPPQRIGEERVDRYFLDDVTQEELFSVWGTEDPIRRIVYWAYRSKDNPTTNSFDKVLCYHYGIDRWTQLVPGEVLLTGLVQAAQPGSTLEDLDAFGTLETLPFSLDSRAWAGGAPTLAAFNTSFELGLFGGDPANAIIRTKGGELASQRRTYVSGFRPLCDAENIEGSVDVKNRAGSSAWTIKAQNPVNGTGIIPARSSGRFHRFLVDIPADEDWSIITGVNPEAQVEGRQ